MSRSDFKADILKLSPDTLYSELTEAFGSNWLEWAVDTVVAHLPETVDPVAIDKVLAVQAVASNIHGVLSTSAMLEKVALAFTNQVCLMDAVQPPEIEDIAYTAKQMESIYSKVAGESKSLPEPAGDVPGYVAAVGKYHQWIVLPAMLSFAQQMLDYLNGSRWRRKDKDFDHTYSELSAFAERLSKLGDIKMDNPPVKALLDALDPGLHHHAEACRIIGCYMYRP